MVVYGKYTMALKYFSESSHLYRKRNDATDWKRLPFQLMSKPQTSTNVAYQQMLLQLTRYKNGAYYRGGFEDY